MQTIVYQSDGTQMPLSKGILSQQLVTVGVDADTSYKVAHSIERELKDKRKHEINGKELDAIISKHLSDEVSAETATRWNKWSHVKSLNIPIILLITGGNGTGKSTLASQLCSRLGINRLTSTDSIREVMRELSVESLVPQIYQSSFNVSPPPGARDDDPIAGFTHQAQSVNIGVQAIIKRAAQEKTSIILEGIHLVPQINTTIHAKGCAVVPVTLIVPDIREHHNRFMMRDIETAGRRPSSEYQQHFKAIRAIHDYLVAEALSCGQLIIDTNNLEQSFPPLVDRIIEALEITEQSI